MNIFYAYPTATLVIGIERQKETNLLFSGRFCLFTNESVVVDVGLVIVRCFFAVIVEGVVADEETLIEYRSSSATLRVHRMTCYAAIYHN